MANGSRQVREKWLDLIANMLSDGKERSEILQTVIKDYKASEGTIDKWIKQAKIIVSERRQQAEAIRVRETEAVIKDAVIDGLKSDLELEIILCQIATNNISVEEWVSGESVLRGVKPNEITKAIEVLYKKRGSNAPDKQEIKGELSLIGTKITFK
jgi:hypothetical protein